MKTTPLPPPIAVVGDPLLADTRSLLLTLRYANLDFKLVEIDTMIGEHRSKAFLEEHPCGYIPVLVENNSKIYGGVF